MTSLITEPSPFISRAEHGGVSLEFLVSSHRWNLVRSAIYQTHDKMVEQREDIVKKRGQEKGICLNPL